MLGWSLFLVTRSSDDMKISSTPPHISPPGYCFGLPSDVGMLLSQSAWLTLRQFGRLTSLRDDAQSYNVALWLNYSDTELGSKTFTQKVNNLPLGYLI